MCLLLTSQCAVAYRSVGQGPEDHRAEAATHLRVDLTQVGW